MHAMGTNVAAAFATLLALLSAGPFARAEGGLWGARNLIADPPVGAGDVVTVVLAPASEAGAAEEAQARPARTAAARVVKRLPNGNLVLEAKVCAGQGYVLMGGEVARADLGSQRTVDISRLANLAVVARGLEEGALSALSRTLAGCGTGEHRFAAAGGRKKKVRK